MAKVYAVECIVTGFVYVGCTRARLNRRRIEHMSLLKTGRHTATRMLADWQAHGSDTFIIKVIEQLPEDASVEARRAAELRWMRHYDSIGKLYNAQMISFGPGARAAIMSATPEAREKRSLALRGKPKHPGHGAKVSATKRRLGQRPSLEAAIKGGIAATNKRYGKTDEIV